jgi:hypothetical protein
MKATIKLKSFPNPGHEGIPGHQGGSLPRDAGGETTQLKAMFDANDKVKDLQNSVELANSQSKRYYKLYTKAYEDRYKKEYEQYNAKYYAAKESLDAAKKELKAASKGVKAPGFGQWLKNIAESPASGHYTHYDVPEHPEYGKVSIQHFGGYRMQHVAASSSVEWNGQQMKWDGNNARESANKFASEVFGI